MQSEVMRDDDYEYAVGVIDDDLEVFITDEYGREIPVKYGIVFRLLDMEEWTGEKSDYPFVMDIRLIPYKPVSKEMIDKAIEYHALPKISMRDPFIRMELLMDVIGGVPVNASLLEKTRNFKRDKVFEGNDVAFKSWEDGIAFIDRYKDDYVAVIRGMVGFILDKRINMIGTTGWDIFESAVFGTNPYGW